MDHSVGFDLGNGILFTYFDAKDVRDAMMNTAAPACDGNEDRMRGSMENSGSSRHRPARVVVPAMSYAIREKFVGADVSQDPGESC